MSDIDFNQTINASIDHSEHASVAMYNLVKRYPGIRIIL